MIKVENVETVGWEPALRGMRNPLESWDSADSEFKYRVVAYENGSLGSCDVFTLGPNDESLMRRLIGQGSRDHCKFRRMIGIYCDVVAPLYWWKEADTYKVGTVANSCSTMHTIMRHKFSADMFSWENVRDVDWTVTVINDLNHLRDWYFEAKDTGDGVEAKRVWNELIQKLPSSWNQRRTLMLNYEVMANIYRARRHHKLMEWREFIAEMVVSLPYPWIFTGEGC